MDWSKVGETVLGEGLPLIGGLLLGPAGQRVGGLVASALGVSPEPDEVAGALQTNPEAFVRLRQLEMEHERELRRMTIEAETNRLAEVNATIRAEVASDDRYVRRMRPTFGYLVAAMLAAQVGATCYVMIWNPNYAEVVTSLIEATIWPMTAALGVLGVYVRGRTQEKRVEAGIAPSGGIANIIKAIRD